MFLATLLGIHMIARGVNAVNGAMVTHNCKKEGQKAFAEMQANTRQWARERAEQNDYYLNKVLWQCYPDFYGDGSVRWDGLTRKTYEKGQYYCKSNGYNVEMKYDPDRSKWAK